MIEEWAAFGKQLFRLDVIADGIRTTYLADGRSKEMFRFKPFICDQLKADSSELSTISSLFKGWNIGDESETMMALGLGPLWLRAEKDSTSQKLIPSSDSLPLEGYTIYDVKMKKNDNEVPYNLLMYFRPERIGIFVDAVEWLSLDKVKNNQPIIVARAKLNKIDLLPIADSVFELPVGYGCVRSFQFDHPLEGHAGLELLHQGGPNQAILEVTLSKPIDSKLLHTWESQKFTARLLRGSMKMIGQAHSYFVALTQSRDPKTSKINRIKRVWTALEKSEQAVVYTINQVTGKCRVSHESCKDHIRFSMASNLQETETNQFKISSDIIASLLNDHENYHMLREGTEMNSDLDSDENPVGSGPSIKDAMFEKRLSNFELIIGGAVIWSGPVSIIKKITSFAMFSGNLDAGNGGEFEETYHTMMTILFYSQDSTELQYKVVVDLIDKDEVDVNFMHKQLDISDCFSDQQKSELIVKYPLESTSLSKKLFAIQDIIQELFCLDLFQSFPIQPIQVSGIETSFDSSYMYLKMTMLELPLTQMFELKRDMRLVKDDSGELIETIAPSVEKCASSCEHYNCYRFSFDTIEMNCRISISRGQVKIEKATQNELYEAVELKLSSDIWGFDDYSGGRSHLRPNEMIEIFEDLYENRGENGDPDDNSLMPLAIRIEQAELPGPHSIGDKEYIELVPISIHSNIDSMNEFIREENILLDQTGETKQSVIRAQDSSQLKVQYNIVSEEHYFKDTAPGVSLDDLSYEDCARFCESIDCRSFSYCKYSRKCHASSLHKLSEIKSAYKYNAKCIISSLDYLSKFDNYGLVEMPTVVKKDITTASARDCAINCIEESSFACHGFSYCETGQTKGSKRCLMQDKHLEETGPSIDQHRPKFKAARSGDSSLSRSMKENSNVCVFYSRSYLAQFDEYFDKNFEIPPEANSEDKSEIVADLGAENCAQRCIKQSCTAFSVCLDNSEGESLKQLCHLAKGEFKRNFVFYQPRCATYVLSDKSQFSSSGRKQSASMMSDSKPNREAILSEQDDRELIVVDPKQQAALKDDLSYRMLHLFSSINRINLLDKSHWLLKLISALGGILIGVGSVFIWKDKDRLRGVALDFTEEMCNRIRRRR